MILYSIIPAEVVFSYSDDKDNKKVEFLWRGEKIEAISLENNRYMINRLLSTSPKAYLDPEFQPGTIIEGKF